MVSLLTLPPEIISLIVSHLPDWPPNFAQLARLSPSFRHECWKQILLTNGASFYEDSDVLRFARFVFDEQLSGPYLKYIRELNVIAELEGQRDRSLVFSLGILQKLPNLEKVDLRMIDCDISELSQLKHVKNLYLRNVEFGDFSGRSFCTPFNNLTMISFTATEMSEKNWITLLSPETLPTVSTLDLYSGNVTSFEDFTSFLKLAPQIINLSIHHPHWSFLYETIPNFSSLRKLHLIGFDLEVLNYIPNLTNLTHFYLDLNNGDDSDATEDTVKFCTVMGFFMLSEEDWLSRVHISVSKGNSERNWYELEEIFEEKGIQYEIIDNHDFVNSEWLYWLKKNKIGEVKVKK